MPALLEGAIFLTSQDRRPLREQRHADAKSCGGEKRIGAGMVLANCAPSVLIGMPSEPMRGKVAETFAGCELFTSLFSVHFGLKDLPSKFGLDRYSTVVLPEWMTAYLDRCRSLGCRETKDLCQFPSTGLGACVFRVR